MSQFTMPKNKALTTLFAALVLVPAGLVSAAPAVASSAQVLADCNSNGHLTGTYSRGDLQGALNGMGADTREYTNCYDVVRRALLSSAAAGGAHTGGGASGVGGGASGVGGGASGGGGGNSSGSGHSAGSHSNPGVSTRGVYSKAPGAAAARSGNGGAVSLDGSTVQPGSTGANTSSGVRSLPAPLIGVLVLLGLAALGGGGIALRRRVVARHGG